MTLLIEKTNELGKVYNRYNFESENDSDKSFYYSLGTF
jgi:hypothetical protein